MSTTEPSTPCSEPADSTAREDLVRLLEVERAARRRAEDALRLRDDLIAMISHDLRNPLSSVVASAAVMRRLTQPDSDPRLYTCLANIGRACDRMRRLVSDLLDASEMEAGTFTVAFGEHDASTIVHEVVQSVEALASVKGLELVALPEPGLRVRCDRERMLQVLENLVTNAIKYTDRGGVTITARGDGEWGCFSVVDSGFGIEVDDRTRVFEKFWRGRTKRSGIGLGLAIAKGIVDAHGGAIWLDSEVGAGTAFHFTVPRTALQPELACAAIG